MKKKLINIEQMNDVKFVTDSKRIRPSRSEVFRLWCDNNKITELTGFIPNIDLREGIQRTIDWVTLPDNLKRYKVEIYNV